MEPINDHERLGKFWRFEHWGAPMLGVVIILLALVGISASRAEPVEAGKEEAAIEEGCSRHECKTCA